MGAGEEGGGWWVVGGGWRVVGEGIRRQHEASPTTESKQVQSCCRDSEGTCSDEQYFLQGCCLLKVSISAGTQVSELSRAGKDMFPSASAHTSRGAE